MYRLDEFNMMSSYFFTQNKHNESNDKIFPVKSSASAYSAISISFSVCVKMESLWFEIVFRVQHGCHSLFSKIYSLYIFTGEVVRNSFCNTFPKLHFCGIHFLNHFMKFMNILSSYLFIDKCCYVWCFHNCYSHFPLCKWELWRYSMMIECLCIYRGRTTHICVDNVIIING